MDTFSITLGVITLVAATNQVIQGAENLRSALKANDQICALINELTDLKCLLTVTDINPAQLAPERASHLKDIIRRAKEKLSELEYIINFRLLKIRSRERDPLPARLTWLREKGKVELIRKELQQLTSAFSVALTASTTGGVIRVELALTDLATTTNLSNDAGRALHGATETRLSQIYQAIQSLHMQHTDMRQILLSLAGVEAGLADEAPPYRELEEGRSQSRWLTTVSDKKAKLASNSYVCIKATPATSGNSCHGQCYCSCHIRKRARTPASLENLMGNLFVGYTGMPLSQRICNLPTCQHQQRGFSAQFTYYFPWWFVARALVATISIGLAMGPEFTLRLPHVVPESSPIFQLARSGNVQGLAYLFNNGLASPYDIAGESGATVLHESIQDRTILADLKPLHRLPLTP